MRGLAWFIVALFGVAACGDGTPSDRDGAVASDGCVEGTCDNGLFCDGVEACGAGGTCAPAAAGPCFPGQTCDESIDRCRTTCGSVTDADDDGRVAAECGGDDCDDGDASVYPGNAELCDPAGRDEDCDPATFGARDVDADGYLDATCCNGSACGDDCDDSVPTIHPDEAESCDALDQDCDDLVDEGVLATWSADCDRDGYGGSVTTMSCSSPTEAPAACPGALWIGVSGDCDDGRAEASPAASEICNALDDDCDLMVDGPVAQTWCNAPAQLASLHATAATCGSAGCDSTACAAPFLDCTTALGCETDSDADPSSCGACGAACLGWTSSCASGTCASTGLAVSAGSEHTCALLPSRAVVCWGRNNFGQLGDGTPTDRPTPGPVTSLADAVEISSGAAHACARRASGAVVCWGHNNFGQLGEGSAAPMRDVPVAVMGLVDAVEIAAGGNHTCARRGSSVVCWGRNTDGELGDGSPTSSRPSPVAASGLTDAVEIAVGNAHSCARRGTGELVCWGDNGSGQLGDGSIVNRPRPGPVSGIFDAVEIATGSNHTCARRASGAVLCWGSNSDGRLGDGTTIDRRSPTAVSGLLDAIDIDAGNTHTCARRAGELLSWGGNSRGQLGDGTMIDRSTPGAVTGLTEALAISCGGSHSCARRADGLVCWGYNLYGQLGDGTTTNRSSPTPVLAP